MGTSSQDGGICLDLAVLAAFVSVAHPSICHLLRDEAERSGWDKQFASLAVIAGNVVRQTVGIERSSCVLVAAVHHLGDAQNPAVSTGAVLMPNPITF